MYNSQFQNNFEDFKNFLTSQNYKQAEKLLLKKVDIKDTQNSMNQIDHQIEQQKNSENKIFWQFQKLQNQKGNEKLETLKETVYNINKSSEFFLNKSQIEDNNYTQEFEFHNMYQFINTTIKSIINNNTKDSINLKILEDLLSNMRTTFGQLKSNECWRSLLYILNIVFFIYFYINQFHACTYLLKMVIDNEKQILKNANQDQKFYYYYYTARIQHFEGNIDEVEQRLENAMKFCETFENQQILLQILIPCKINLYAFPKEDLLNRFGLQEFKEFSKSIKNGDIKTYETIMNLNMIQWIKKGIFFFLKETKSICQRNFIKNFYLAQNKQQVIELKLLLFCYNMFASDQIDMNYLIGMLSGLISKEFIKGKIVLDQEKMVLSTQNAFPPLEYEGPE